MYSRPQGCLVLIIYIIPRLVVEWDTSLDLVGNQPCKIAAVVPNRFCCSSISIVKVNGKFLFTTIIELLL